MLVGRRPEDQDAVLECVAAYQQRVRARALRAVRRATVAVGADNRVERVKARQEMLRFAIGRDAGGNALNRAHRRHFLLSGLLICGSCGGGCHCLNQRTTATCRRPAPTQSGCVLSSLQCPPRAASRRLGSSTSC